MIFLGHQDFIINKLKHWKYLKVIDVMVIPLCPMTPAIPILEIHNGACGYAYLHGIACHTAIAIIWHTTMLNLVKRGVELKMIWLNWSILIMWGFLFQFNSNSKSCNSFSIQFYAELNWLSIPIQFMHWSELWLVIICRGSCCLIGSRQRRKLQYCVKSQNVSLGSIYSLTCPWAGMK